MENRVIILFCMLGLSLLDLNCRGLSSSIDMEKVIPDFEINEDDLGLYLTDQGVLLLDTIPYSGYVLTQYPTGEMKTQKGYWNGKLEGQSMFYFTNGKIAQERIYSTGEKHGEHFGYYANGQMRFHYIFHNGFGEGTHSTWFQNGDLASEMNYKAGHEFGSQKVWRPDGKLRSNYVIRENGRRYGMLGVKRCAKIDSETGNIDPYMGTLK